MINLEKIRSDLSKPPPSTELEWMDFRANILAVLDFAEKQKEEKEIIHNMIMHLAAQIYKNNYVRAKNDV